VQEEPAAAQEQGEQPDEPQPGDGLGRIIEDLNPMLRGWFDYFKHATSAFLGALDGFVGRRLRAILSNRKSAPTSGHCQTDHHRWPQCLLRSLWAIHPSRGR
jgi:RNA-directed DNA polymerase